MPNHCVVVVGGRRVFCKRYRIFQDTYWIMIPSKLRNSFCVYDKNKLKKVINYSFFFFNLSEELMVSCIVFYMDPCIIIFYSVWYYSI